jgi:hypothetical protein
MIERYEHDRALIPEENLVEIRFEDFVKAPRNYINDIYTQFGADMDEATSAKMDAILDGYSNHKSGRYEIDPEIKKLIHAHFGDWMKTWKYL